MAWGDSPDKPHTPYPDQRPGSAWSDKREEAAQAMAERSRQKGESWRDKATRLGIAAYSADDLWDKIEHQEDQDRMAQLEHEAESKCTDLQLSHPGENITLDRFGCSFCGHEGTEADLIHPKKSNGDGLGEWVCRVGVGCRHDEY